MQSIEAYKNINLGIAQMISIFERRIDKKCIEWYLENVNDINQRVLATKYLQTNKPEYINCTALHLAFINNNKKAFDIFLKFNSDFTLRNKNGLTIIHQVIQQSCINSKNSWILSNQLKNYFVDAVLSAHIQFGNPANPCDSNGISHFHAACMSNHTEAVEFFLNNGVSVSQAVHESSLVLPGYTPLHFAVSCSSVDVVKVLLKNGANVHSKDANGVTPFYTLMQQKMGMIEKKYGIIEQKYQISEKNYQELITDNELVICLLLRNSNNEQNVDDRFSHFEDFLERNAAMGTKDSRDWALLHPAFKRWKDKFASSVLMYHHKVINPIGRKRGLSQLHIACTRIGNKSSIERLLSTGTGVNIVYRGKSLSIIHENSTPLHIALYNKNYEAALLLLTHGADVYAKDINNLTPLHHLLDNSHVIPESIYEFLFSNSDLQNNLYERTGLDLTHIACASYSMNVFPLRRLLNSGAMVNRKFNCIGQSFYMQFENFTPLQFAVNIGSTKLVDLLISRGANLFLESPTYFKSFSESYVSCLKHLIMQTEHSATLRRFKNDLNLTSLHVACYNIDVGKIKDLLATDLDVNAQIFSNSPIWPGSTPLHVLLYRYLDENINIEEQNFLFGLLIGKGADVTVTNAEQLSPLCMAFSLFNRGKLQLSQVLKILKSQKNFDVNPVNNEGISHLYIACYIGDTAMAKKFLDYQANVNEGADIFSSGYPSLLHAVLDIHKISGVHNENLLQSCKAARLLLEYGVDVSVIDREGNTPLHVVVENFQSSSRESLIQEMIDCGCDGTARNLKGESAFEIILRKHNCTVKEFKSFIKKLNYLNVFNPITKEGLIGLIFSNPNLCEVAFNLIKNKPHIAKTDNEGRTAIHSIFSVDEYIFHKKQFYLEYAQIVDCDINAQDKLGRTALHFVSKNYGEAAVSDLLSAGAKVNIINRKGNTPLHIALQHKNTEAVSALLKGGADVNVINAKGDAPLHIAVRHQIIKAISALLKSGADATIVDASGYTPLHIAVRCRNIKMVSALLKGKADTDIIDAKGRTPLSIATQLSDNKAVKELLWFGADINIKDVNGQLPVNYVRFYNSQVTETFATHIYKLEHCGFYLRRLNASLESFLSYTRIYDPKTFEQQLEKTKNIIIEPYSLSLYDYFSKIDAMVDNPCKSQFKCQAIKEFFKSNGNTEFSKKFSEIMPILNLLYRKVLKVLKFIEQNRVSFNIITGFPLPDLCFQAILKYLDKTSMKNLIDSTADVNCSSR